jgi:hypothetical protein
MRVLTLPEFGHQEQPATDEQLERLRRRGETLSRDLAEEKLSLGWAVLIVFSASLALWAIIIFALSQIYF